MVDKTKDIFFVRRPIVAIVIAIFMAIIGGVALIGLPIEQYPNITPPVVRVNTMFPGADAVGVEQSVAAPLEQEVNGVDNMLYMKSTNANDGTMNLDITFDLGTDPDLNTVFAQTRVAAATPKLPEEVKRLGVKTAKSMPNVLLLLALVSPDERYDRNFLGNYAMLNLKDQLARIKGIGRVDVLGSSEYAMRVWVKPDRLAQMNLTVPEIMRAVQEQNTVAPGGNLGQSLRRKARSSLIRCVFPIAWQTRKHLVTLSRARLPTAARLGCAMWPAWNWGWRIIRPAPN